VYLIVFYIIPYETRRRTTHHGFYANFKHEINCGGGVVKIVEVLVCSYNKAHPLLIRIADSF
jgi:hypothetical protein